MSWPASILVGLILGIAGCFGAGAVASLCVRWYRISSFEGGSGYYVVFLALLGAIVGSIVGVVTSRVVAAGSSPGFLHGLGLAFAILIGLLGIATLLAWLGADFPPKIEGRELVIEFEVRCPAGMEPPRKAPSGERWYLYVTEDHGKRAQYLSDFELDKAAPVDGRWILPATVYFASSAPTKSLGVAIAGRPPQFFRLNFSQKLSRRDLEWTAWLPGPTFGEIDKIPRDQLLAVRYRVQFFVPPPEPPPQPTQEETEAAARAAEDAAFAALTPDSPFEAWLEFTHYAKPQRQRELAAAALLRRPDLVEKLSIHVESSDREDADLALRSFALMNPPPAALAPAVIRVGRQIVEEIRRVNATTAEEDPSYERAAAADVRFAGWHEAARTVHGQPGADLLPVMREILEVARVRSESHSMSDVVRVSGFYVNQWSGKTPPPSKSP